MITLSSTGFDVQLFHYDCRAILLSIQSLPRIFLRRCCGGGAMMMPKMILIWGFRDFGEGLIPDMHKRELEKKKKIQVLFLINWEEGGGGLVF